MAMKLGGFPTETELLLASLLFPVRFSWFLWSSVRDSRQSLAERQFDRHNKTFIRTRF